MKPQKRASLLGRVILPVAGIGTVIAAPIVWWIASGLVSHPSTQRFFDGGKWAGFQLITLFVMVVVLLVAAAYWLMDRFVIAPTQAIASVLDRRKAGDAEAYCDAESSDEIGALAARLNEMLRVLDERNALLRRNESRFRAMSDASPLGVFFTDVAGKPTYANDALLTMWGRPREQILDRDWTEFVSADDRPNAENDWRHAIDNRHSLAVFHRMDRPDGSTAHLGLRAAPVMDGEEFQGFVGTVADFTAMQTAHESKVAQLRLMEALMNAIPAPVYYKDLNGVYLGCNEAFKDFAGCREEGVVGRTTEEVVDDPHAEFYKAKDRELLQSGGTQVFEDTSFDRKGRSRDTIFHRATFNDAAGNLAGIVAILVDITERNKAATELRDSEAALRSLTEAAQDAVVSVDGKQRVTLWNKAAERMFGYTKAEAMGREIHSLVLPENGFDNEDYRVAALTAVGQGRALGKTVELEARRKDGAVVPIELSLSMFEVDGERHAIAIVRDITERKAVDRLLTSANTELQAALERANQLAVASEAANIAKGAFLANVSHEIRTPMNGVIGMADLLLETELTPDQREYAATIRNSAGALLSVINDILDYSKAEAGKLTIESTEFSLRTILEEIGDILAPKAHEKGVELICHIVNGTPEELIGDPVRIRQVLMNLVGNAVKFTDSGEIVIEAKLVSRGKQPKQLRIEVRDTGIGIAKALHDRIFESFTQADPTTTRKYGGTGLGLAISKQLVLLMGGSIEVAGEEGVGSKFSIELPIGIKEPRANRLSNAQLKGCRILVVTANRTNRMQLSEYLTGSGCTVLVAPTSEGAVELLTPTGTCDVVLLDMLTLGNGAAEAAQRIRKELAMPGLPIVAMAPIRAAQAIAGESFTAWMSKPTKLAQLLNTVAEATGRRKMTVVSPTVPNQPRGILLGVRVLVAEDNATSQKVVSRILDRFGCKVESVSTGAAAVERACSGDFDAVLMDFRLHDMSGPEATRLIRERMASSDRRLPVIALTAHAVAEAKEACLAAGMDDFLTKPIDRSALFDSLRLFCGVPVDESAISYALEIDRAGLLELCGGDEEAVRNIVDEYVVAAHELAATIEASASRADWAQVGRAAHTLKGSSASVGAQTLAELSANLEKAAKDADGKHALELVAQVAEAIADLYAVSRYDEAA